MNSRPAVLALLFLLLLPAGAEGLGGPAARRDLLAFFHGGGGGKEKVLRAKERSLAREELGSLEGKASLVLFTEEEGCETCGEAERFVEEMAALAPKVSCEILSLTADGRRAAELGIDKVPGMAIIGAGDSGIRYFGLPLGYEFGEFVKALRQVMDSKPALAPETLLALSRLNRQITLTVFVVDT